MKIHELRTSRLFLRNWKDSDIAPFIAMGCDEHVMKFFPSLHGEEQSREFIRRTKEGFIECGWGLWAVEELASGEFLGFTGIKPIIEEFPVSSIQTPLVEVGWRLRPEWWNKGIATEGALASLQFGFEILKLKEIVSFTSVLNVPSIRVMQKIGMKRDIDADFDHPRVPEGNKLRKHLLYRISNYDWEQMR
jgi:RimJ/RimL family protein N-acetyltransferase